MTHELEQFLSRVPELQRKTKREMLGFLAYFVSLQQDSPVIRPADVGRCFDQAGIPGPASTSTEMERSGLFFRSKLGWQLRREVRDRIAGDLGPLQGDNSNAVVHSLDAPRH